MEEHSDIVSLRLDSSETDAPEGVVSGLSTFIFVAK